MAGAFVLNLPAGGSLSASAARGAGLMVLVALAEAVLSLPSDRARYVTGTQLVLDAGLLTR